MGQMDRTYYGRLRSRLLRAIRIKEGGYTYYGLYRAIDTTPRDDDRFYNVKLDERIDQIAYTQLGDPRHWWVIAEYNNIDFPLELEPGTTLRLPSMNRLELDILG